MYVYMCICNMCYYVYFYMYAKTMNYYELCKKETLNLELKCESYGLMKLLSNLN
jgi:hypothetical protein